MNGVMSYEDYQRFLQYQNYVSQQQVVPQQPQMVPQPQYNTAYQMPQQMMMIPPQQMVPQMAPTPQDIITVEPAEVMERKPLKHGQANDLPVSQSRTHLEGTKKTIKDVLDKNIVVKEIRTISSKFKHPNSTTCNMYQFSFVNSKSQNIDELENHIFISGSKILAEQSQKYSSYLPFYTRVVFVNNRYYSFETARFDIPNET